MPGTVIFQNWVHVPAPSIEADSYSSDGTSPIAAKSMTTVEPTPQQVIMTSAGFVQTGLPSQFTDGSPIRLRNRLR